MNETTQDGQNNRRLRLIRLIGNVSRAGREVQMQCDFCPESYGGRNTTKIAAASRAERQAIRELVEFIGLPTPTMEELARCQNPYEDKVCKNA